MQSKAQASTEYLVILAVVIIIAVAVAGIMGNFLSFGGGTSEKTGKIYWKTAEIGVLEWIINGDDLDTIVLRNNQEYDLFIRNVTINNVQRSINITLVPGETKTVSNEWIACAPNSGYAYPIVFLYDNTEFNLTSKKFSGSEKLSGTCQ